MASVWGFIQIEFYHGGQRRAARLFNADHQGHVQAVEDAAKWLREALMPEATDRDQNQDRLGRSPVAGWGPDSGLHPDKPSAPNEAVFWDGLKGIVNKEEP